MKNKLTKDRIKWGFVAALGLGFSLTTSENNAEKEAIPDKMEESKDEAAQIVRLEAPCTSSFLIIHSY